MSETTRLDIPIDVETDRKLTAYAEALGRTKADVVADALERYLDYEQWFRRQVEEGLRADAAGEIRDHDDAVADLKTRRNG
jgi:predicted transcriptional regulator